MDQRPRRTVGQSMLEDRTGVFLKKTRVFLKKTRVFFKKTAVFLKQTAVFVKVHRSKELIMCFSGRILLLQL
ncbi:unnamed protein product [Arctogadus glacialis]